MPYGVNIRPDSYCPQCGSKERQRLLWEFLSREYSFENTDILYFAPNESLKTKLSQIETISLTTVDLKNKNVDCQANITELPLPQKTFDIIICSHVLEHIANDDFALKELYRLLRSGGEAIILLPQDRERQKTYEVPTVKTALGRWIEFGQFNHVRQYGDDVRNIIRSAGFTVSRINYFEQLNDSSIEKHRLRESNQWIHSPTRIFLCSRENDHTFNGNE